MFRKRHNEKDVEVLAPKTRYGNFACKVCDKTFRREDSMYNHLKTHLVENIAIEDNIAIAENTLPQFAFANSNDIGDKNTIITTI